MQLNFSRQKLTCSADFHLHSTTNSAADSQSEHYPFNVSVCTTCGFYCRFALDFQLENPLCVDLPSSCSFIKEIPIYGRDVIDAGQQLSCIYMQGSSCLPNGKQYAQDRLRSPVRTGFQRKPVRLALITGHIALHTKK